MFFSFQTCIIFLLEKAKQLSEIHVLLEMEKDQIAMIRNNCLTKYHVLTI